MTSSYVKNTHERAQMYIGVQPAMFLTFIFRTVCFTGVQTADFWCRRDIDGKSTLHIVAWCWRLCVAVCCSVLQCDAVWCSVLQCVAVCCSVMYDTWNATRLYILLRDVQGSVLQCVAVCCSVLQCVAVWCITLCMLFKIQIWGFRVSGQCRRCGWHTSASCVWHILWISMGTRSDKEDYKKE